MQEFTISVIFFRIALKRPLDFNLFNFMLLIYGYPIANFNIDHNKSCFEGLVIIIMVIFKCYFSGEHIDL